MSPRREGGLRQDLFVTAPAAAQVQEQVHGVVALQAGGHALEPGQEPPDLRHGPLLRERLELPEETPHVFVTHLVVGIPAGDRRDPHLGEPEVQEVIDDAGRAVGTAELDYERTYRRAIRGVTWVVLPPVD